MHRLSLLTFVLGLIALSRANTIKPKPHDLIVGVRVNGDELVRKEFVNVNSFLLTSLERDVEVRTGGPRITRVEVIDVKGNGNNATPAVVKGGPNEDHVVVHFRSKRAHGIHYLVLVYAK